MMDVILSYLAATEAAYKPVATYAALTGGVAYCVFIQHWYMENYFGARWTNQNLQASLIRINIAVSVVLAFWATAAYASVLVGLAVSVALFIPLVLLRGLIGMVAR